MRDPVVDSNGNTFDRSAIENCLAQRPGICPLTKKRYPNGSTRLTPNRVVRDMVVAFRKAGGNIYALAPISVPQAPRKSAVEVEDEEEEEPAEKGVKTAYHLNVAQLLRDGDFRGLVRALEDATADDGIKANAAFALGMFSSTNAADKAAVVTEGAVKALMKLLRRGSDEGRANAAGALGSLLFGREDIAVAVVAAGAYNRRYSIKQYICITV
jgi:hypothetical protein